MFISQSCQQEKRALIFPVKNRGKHKTSHSGFVYRRYFWITEKVGGERGLTLPFAQAAAPLRTEECPNNLAGTNKVS
jgi:hypothetical protein